LVEEAPREFRAKVIDDCGDLGGDDARVGSPQCPFGLFSDDDEA
jgi:hypothetical protein